MTLSVQLSDEQTAALKAKAQAQGMSAEQYVQQVLENDFENGAAPRRHISEVIREIWSDLPDESRAKLPTDGASQVDHYVHGLPKRSQ